MNIDAGTVAVSVAVLNIAVTVGGGGFFAGVLTGKVKRIETDVAETKSLLVTSAVEADRLRRAEADIHNIEDDIGRLRRGVGWVNDGNAAGVNREY
jgi:hypothetical protein